jgi:hypothetical protein
MQNESWLVLVWLKRPMLPGCVKNPTCLIEKWPVVPMSNSLSEAVELELDLNEARELYS